MTRFPRQLRVLAVVVLAIGTLAVGCTDRQTPAAGRDGPGHPRPAQNQSGDFEPRAITPAPLREPPSDISFVFGNEVSDATREEVRGAFGLTHDYFTITGAGGLPEMKVFAHFDLDQLIREFRDELTIVPTEYTRPEWWEQRGGVAVGSTIFLNLQDDYGDQDREYMRYEIVRIVAHEVAHVVHYNLAGVSDPLSSIGQPVPPMWFIEGSAEVEARTMLEMFGFGDYEYERESSAESVRSTVAALGELEKGTLELYAMGFLAVDFLTQGGDLAPMRAAWAGLRELDWPSSFLAAFGGVTLGDFESDFESHRQLNFPRHRGELSGRVTDAAELDEVAYVWACGRAYGECYSTQVRPEGTFSLAVPDGRYTLQFGFDTGYFGEPGGDARYFAGIGLGLVDNEEEAHTFRVYGERVEAGEIPLGN